MEIIQHLTDFNISDCFYCFCIDDYPVFNDQIGNILINLRPFIQNGKNRLLGNV